MPDESSSPVDPANQPSSDPYVIYQLRKPSQRGTAVIPRFVPNTHAPAYSPANYRFARVWPTADSSTSPSSILHAPRSFEYAGSLGSESSIWSDTSSWVSVSSLRTAPSEVRTPLLHQPPAPVSAASFFEKDLDDEAPSHPRHHVHSSSARSSEISSPGRPSFRYPPALSESVSEDAIVDDLLSMHQYSPPSHHHRSQYPSHDYTRHSPERHQRHSHHQQSHQKHPSTSSSPRNPDRERERDRERNDRERNDRERNDRERNDRDRDRDRDSKREVQITRTTARHVRTVAQPAAKAAHLPALTRKRRSLWQWLFCADTNAHSSVASVRMDGPPSVRDRPRLPPPQNLQNSSSITPSNQSSSSNPNPNSVSNTSPSSAADRVPNADKEFINLGRNAPDAAEAQVKSARRRRSPSFEILRGRPSKSDQSRRSLSWSLVPRALLGLDKDNDKEKEPTSFTQRRRSTKTKDRPRGIPPEQSKPSSFFRRPSLQRPSREADKKRRSQTKKSDLHRSSPSKDRADQLSRESSKEERHKSDKPKVTRSREVKVRSTALDTNESRKPRETRSREVRVPLKNSSERQDRPREARKSGATDSHGGPPVGKSVVPSLREKAAANGGAHMHRPRGRTGSDHGSSRMGSDKNSSRVGSDLSSKSNPRSINSGRSTPILKHATISSAVHDAESSVSGVSNEASSYASSGLGKAPSPIPRYAPPGAESGMEAAPASSPDMNSADTSASPPFRAQLFQFHSSSSEGSAMAEAQIRTPVWEEAPKLQPSTEYGSTAVRGPKERHGLSAHMPDHVARAMERNRARSNGGPLSYLLKHHDNEGDINTGSTGLTSLADESVTTHRSVSGTGDEYGVAGRGNNGRSGMAQEGGFEGNSSDARPIFQNSALFGGTKSPRSGPASPRRFHSDWSDPHATIIDVYCQCNCSCVYEEECRRDCELEYGHSPSVSSTRSCGRRVVIGPGMKSTGYGEANGGNAQGNEESVAVNGVSRISRTSSGKPVKTMIRANAVDELPDISSGRRGTSRTRPPLHPPKNGTSRGGISAQKNGNTASRAVRMASDERRTGTTRLGEGAKTPGLPGGERSSTPRPGSGGVTVSGRRRSDVVDGKVGGRISGGGQAVERRRRETERLPASRDGRTPESGGGARGDGHGVRRGPGARGGHVRAEDDKHGSGNEQLKGRRVVKNGHQKHRTALFGIF